MLMFVYRKTNVWSSYGVNNVFSYLQKNMVSSYNNGDKSDALDQLYKRAQMAGWMF